MISDEEIKERIIRNSRVALLERVTANMRVIKLHVQNGFAEIEFIFDGDFSEDDEECVDEFETEILSHFIYNIVSCKKTVKESDGEININKCEKVLYARKESKSYLVYR